MNYIEKPEIKEGGTAHFPTQMPLNDKVIMLRKIQKWRKDVQTIIHSLIPWISQLIGLEVPLTINPSVRHSSVEAVRNSANSQLHDIILGVK